MSTALITAAIEFERGYARPDQLESSGGAPYLAVPARVAFMAGAAAMAELFAHGQGPVLEALQALQDEKQTPKTYLIWSFQHAAWWGPNQQGYTPDIREAGVYSLPEALAICTRANIAGPDEAMVAKFPTWNEPTS